MKMDELRDRASLKTVNKQKLNGRKITQICKNNEKMFL